MSVLVHQTGNTRTGMMSEDVKYEIFTSAFHLLFQGRSVLAVPIANCKNVLYKLT